MILCNAGKKRSPSLTNVNPIKQQTLTFFASIIFDFIRLSRLQWQFYSPYSSTILQHNIIYALGINVHFKMRQVTYVRYFQSYYHLLFSGIHYNTHSRIKEFVTLVPIIPAEDNYTKRVLSGLTGDDEYKSLIMDDSHYGFIMDNATSNGDVLYAKHRHLFFDDLPKSINFC